MKNTPSWLAFEKQFKKIQTLGNKSTLSNEKVNFSCLFYFTNALVSSHPIYFNFVLKDMLKKAGPTEFQLSETTGSHEAGLIQ